MTKFHAHSNIYFERGPNATVVVEMLDKGEPVWSAGFDAGTWCSIVANVSLRGEDYHSFQLAQNLHTGGLTEQVDKLARFIIDTFPGEPSKSESAIDSAIRLLDQLCKERDNGS